MSKMNNMLESLDSEGLLYIARAWDKKVSLKVRKIRLLQALDLPLDETYVFTHAMVRTDISQVLRMAEYLLAKYGGVFVRTAWNPDLFGAPWFRTSSISELELFLSTLEVSLDRLYSSSRLTHLILHSDSTNPSDPNDRYRYIAGRILFHPWQDIPRDRTIEVVYGEYIARILDTKGFDFKDDRFAGYKIDVGQRCWRPFKESSWITTNDMRIILNNLKRIDDKLQQLMQVLSFVACRPVADLALFVEFEASKVSERVFYTYDFDYAFVGSYHRSGTKC